MALETCKECGHQISSKATACPSCGVPIKRTSAGVKAIAWLIAFSFVASMVVSCISGREEKERAAAEAQRISRLTPEQKAAENKAKAEAAKKEAEAKLRVSAVYACKQFITNNMKDPSSTEFLIPSDETPVSIRKNGQYDVATKVRAKNSFGAFTVSVFSCRLSLIGSDWRLVGLKETH